MASPRPASDYASSASQKLEREFGEPVSGCLKDHAVIASMLKSDRVLWAERIGQPMASLGKMPPPQGEAALVTMAALPETIVIRGNPVLECELLLGGGRSITVRHSLHRRWLTKRWNLKMQRCRSRRRRRGLIFGGRGMTDLATFRPDLQEATHALTVLRPWASLIVLGPKPCEFRRWPTPKSFVSRAIPIPAARRACEEIRAIARDLERSCFGSDAADGARVCNVDPAWCCAAARRKGGHAWRASTRDQPGMCELRSGGLGLARFVGSRAFSAATQARKAGLLELVSKEGIRG